MDLHLHPKDSKDKSEAEPEPADARKQPTDLTVGQNMGMTTQKLHM